MVLELRHQPFRTLYIAYELVLTICFRAPYWVLTSIPPSLRPRRSWTFVETLKVKLLTHWGPLGHVGTKVGPVLPAPDYHAIATSRGIWISPAPHLLAGPVAELATQAGVECIRIPGYWLPRRGHQHIAPGAPASPGEKVLYVLHGGGYVSCSASDTDLIAEIAKSVLGHCPGVRRAFSVEYRLSVGRPCVPENPFPAALIDALAGYNYLVDVCGFEPRDIIIEGDSAGGNLALALTRYLLEVPSASPGIKLPAPPGALILLSPWTDLSDSHYFSPHSSGIANGASDFLLGPFSEIMQYAKLAFVGPFGPELAETNAYVSPACLLSSMGHVSFEGFPRTFISAGGGERFLDQIRTLRDIMVRDLGEETVVYDEAPDAPHDYLVSGPGTMRTLRNIEQFLTQDEE